MDIKYCGQCGAKNNKGNRFCTSCGELVTQIEVENSNSPANNNSSEIYTNDRYYDLQIILSNVIDNDERMIVAVENGSIEYSKAKGKVILSSRIIPKLEFDESFLKSLQDLGFENTEEGFVNQTVITYKEQVVNKLVDQAKLIFETGLYSDKTEDFLFEELTQTELNTALVEPPQKKKDGTYIALFLVGFAILVTVYYNYINPPNSGNKEIYHAVSNESTTNNESTTVKVGAPLHTEYFDVTVNSVSVESYVNTGNEFADLKEQDGTVYLVLDVTFKNTDTESRMILPGSVFVNYNGTQYNNDTPESIIGAGANWDIMPGEAINPLAFKRTKVVFKISDQIEGKAYYNPGRSDETQLIYLGTIAKNNGKN